MSAPRLGDFIKRYQDHYQYHNLPIEAVLGNVKEFSTSLQLQFCRTNSNVRMQSQSRDLGTSSIDVISQPFSQNHISGGVTRQLFKTSLYFVTYVTTLFPRTSAPARLKVEVLILEGGHLIREALLNFSFQQTVFLFCINVS